METRKHCRGSLGNKLRANRETQRASGYTLRMGDPRFCLFGQAQTEIAMPGTAAQAQEMVCRAQNEALFPWGGGMRQHVGYAPERSGMIVSTERLQAVTDYEPADLVVSAQAGMTVGALQDVLAQQGQWLPLSVARPDAQTVGGIVAARAHSLMRLGYGSVRDSLLGVQVVNAQGEMVQGGGKVMKNVSGYDLPKLYCGSWGTLGLIAEATFKVAPLPAASATAALALPADRNSEDTLDALMASALTPSFLLLLSPQAARDILEADDDAQYLAIGFDGLAEDVQWQLDTLGTEGVLPPSIAQQVRARLRDFSLRPAPMTCAFHILSSQVGAYSRMMEWTAKRAGFTASVLSDAALGIVHAHFAPQDETSDWAVFSADLQDKAARVGGSFLVERMPNALRRAGMEVWLPLMPEMTLMGRIKAKLDPRRQWNPGRFAGRL